MNAPSAVASVVTPQEVPTDQRMPAGGVEFLIHGVPGWFLPNGKTAMEGATVKALWLRVAAVLATTGASSGASFRFVRKALRLSAADVATLLGRTPETISHWETGHTPVDRMALAVLGAMVRDLAAGRTDTRDHLAAMAEGRMPTEVVELEYCG